MKYHDLIMITTCSENENDKSLLNLFISCLLLEFPVNWNFTQRQINGELIELLEKPKIPFFLPLPYSSVNFIEKNPSI